MDKSDAEQAMRIAKQLMEGTTVPTGGKGPSAAAVLAFLTVNAFSTECACVVCAGLREGFSEARADRIKAMN